MPGALLAQFAQDGWEWRLNDLRYNPAWHWLVGVDSARRLECKACRKPGGRTDLPKRSAGIGRIGSRLFTL